jgi:hypothetical protein
MRVAILVASFALACQPLPTPQPPSPKADAAQPPPAPTPSDAGIDVAPACATCVCACAVLEWAGCPESRPTQRQPILRCEEVCEEINDFPGMRLPTVCVSAARSIEEIRKCGVRCESQ